MNDDDRSKLNELEVEFTQEERGEGALALHIIGDSAVSNGEPTSKETYIGYDIHALDLEALYFEGLMVPRWETIEGDDVEKKTETYWKLFNERLSDYPLIKRVRDTDERVYYNSGEAAQLCEEIGQLLSKTSDERAIRAEQKLNVACHKAADRNMGLILVPSNNTKAADF